MTGKLAWNERGPGESTEKHRSLTTATMSTGTVVGTPGV